jgi:PAS domain S-box-containing protein
MVLDITERKRVEKTLRSALEESQQRQTEITALLAGSHAVLKYHEFTSAARAMFDSCKNLIGATTGYVALLSEDGDKIEVLFLDTGGLPCPVDPSLPMPIRGLREQVYRTGQTIYDNNFARSEWMHLMPEGHVRLDNVLFAPLVLEGQAVGLLGLANKPNDFSEADARMASAFGELAAIALHNSRTLESLADSEERFRSVVETASDAIITIDSQGHIVFWNQTAENIFGYSADEILGKPLTFIMPKKFHRDHQKGLERVIATKKSNIISQTIQLAGLRKDGGEFPLELSLATWKTRKGIFFTGIIRDITEHKQTEETLQDSIEKLKIAYQQATIYAQELTGEIVERKRVEEELKRLKG